MTTRLIVFASLALAAAGVASAQEPYVLDHFTCYITPEHPTVTVPLVLTDAFTAADQMPVVASEIRMTLFCNPATKRVVSPTTIPAVPIAHPDAHLAMYAIASTPEYNSPAVIRSVEVTNQFGKQTFMTDYADYLLVPSGKELIPAKGSVTPPTQPPASELDHFMCYHVDVGNSVGATVLLNDEFFNVDHTEVGAVLSPQFFCNPVQKAIAGPPSGCLNNLSTCPSSTTPIEHPASHLVCYHVQTKSTFNRGILYINQFVPPGSIEATQVTSLYLLCVPSQLVSWLPVPGPNGPGGGE